ncbi:MAG: O-antigen ligase family protein [Lachnospiraceae bacterium]|nr:O-antigen ligase family protein [Lachnospiraceae bacterium]
MKFKRTTLLTISTYMFFVMTYIEDTIPFGQVLTFLSLAMMILSCHGLGRNGHSVPFKSGYLIYVAAFFMYSVASMVLWAEIPVRTLIIVRGMFMILIEMTIVYSCHYERTPIDTFLKILMDGGYIVVIYAVFRYGWSEIMTNLAEDIRISNEFLNANTLGMCAAYAIVINFYYMIYERPRLHDLLIIPSVVIIAASGSRKSIIIVVAGALMLIVMRNRHNRRFVNNLLKSFLGIAVIVGLVFILSRLPMFSILRRRMVGLVAIISGTAERGTAGYIRMIYNQIGIDLFRKHPLFGIGLHNGIKYIGSYYGHVHFHNNYVELLACGGLAGFLVYYSIYAYLLAGFWKTRKRRTNEYDICLIIFIIRMVMGYGHIQYYQIATYFYLMIFFLLVTRLKKQNGDPMDAAQQ